MTVLQVDPHRLPIILSSFVLFHPVSFPGDKQAFIPENQPFTDFSCEQLYCSHKFAAIYLRSGSTAGTRVILIMKICSFTPGLKRQFDREVIRRIQLSNQYPEEILHEECLDHLPESVKKYLHYTGMTGKLKTRNVFIRASGRIRSAPESGWMSFSSWQYNFFDDPLRIFYIKARKMGVPAIGLHLYKEQIAFMDIRLAGFLQIAYARGPEMNQAETVTILNDMCFMAPASLISPDIEWEETDPLNLKASYRNGDIRISAKLTFDQDGRLINFLSFDRYETSGNQFINYPWETPVRDYGNFNGYLLPSQADVIYKHPEEDFCYLEFKLEEIRYNVKSPVKIR